MTTTPVPLDLDRNTDPTGYVILTETQPDFTEPGIWAPDWDGLLHTTLDAAKAEETEARKTSRARLVACYHVDVVPALLAELATERRQGASMASFADGAIRQIAEERDAAREELAKVRAELDGRIAWLYRNSTRMTQMRYDAATAAGYDFTQYTATMEQPADRDALIAYLREEITLAEREIALVDASPATTAEPATLPLLPDIAHMTTQLPDDDAPPMAVGIIPNCARCDGHMFVGHRCPAEAADEPKATRCCPRHREPGEARYGCATAPGVTDPCCNDCHYWIAWNRYLDGGDDEPECGHDRAKADDTECPECGADLAALDAEPAAS